MDSASTDVVRAVATCGSALDGYSDHIFMIVDVSDPTKPFEVSRWWLLVIVGRGETPTWLVTVALHHAIIAGHRLRFVA
jgi:hypothetical protein